MRSWLTTTDHKRIALLYLGTMTLFFVLGGLIATVIRLELATAASDLVTAETYNRLFTLHGVIMVWFFLIPSIPAFLGNYLLPLMLGAPDLAFPRLNLASWYVFVAGGVLTLSAMIAGGIDTGWTFYTPYSTTFSDSHVVLAVLGVFLAGVSSVFTGLNFIVSTHRLRAPGQTWMRLPLFVWSLYATSLILVLATPVLAMLLLLIAVERGLQIGIFDPGVGGSPLLFQHFFWFYSHPAVYIMILPGMGVVSELIPCFSRSRPFGYGFIAASSLAIAVFGFLVWGHHMFVAGQSYFASVVFSFLSFAVAVPSGVKVFSWLGTMRRGAIWLTTPMIYALGFVGLFTIGGGTGLALAMLAVDVHLHDTYFVVAHFHTIMVGGMLMAYLGGLHFWWPKISGRMYSERWGRIAAYLLFVGFLLTFLPQFVLGTQGLPRRTASYPEEYQFLQSLSSAGATILALGYVLPGVYLLLSLVRGRPAGDNPWGATGLEWHTTSPPPPHNFAVPPLVLVDPYDYPRAPQPTAEALDA
ncbi:cytochrome c oxidase subunit I [Nannocystis pusilla]|uniref:Cbb3-type cytochrome c oxidase subunit I n=1 Tax=Nannocystis pusilla TaxID=889268 RepID=A0ABS7TKI0_9BACT|nr:cbb3-type cytochrome c oxidase subunit I [Nannocystis pusilla]MBZ5708601.1 cbb3-type cytochrome c oxidase subunit I [Nannocystis pusilla]